MRFTRLRTTSLLLIALMSMGANWSQWRGPFFNGSTDEVNLPTEFSQTDNVLWSVDLPGPSAATPVIWGDRVFLSSTDVEQGRLLATCYDRTSGKQLWKKELGDGIKRDYRSTFAAPSPATDGEVVVFFYGNGDLLVFDLDGNEKWKKNIGPFAFGWTFSTSPVLYDGKLIMQVLQRDVQVSGRGTEGFNESFLLALNPQTGSEIWRVKRPSKAAAESLEAFTTPVPYESNGKKQLLVAGGDDLTGHDLETGKELWRWGTWNPTRIGHWRLVPSPVGGDDVVLVCAPKGSPVYAVKAWESGTQEFDSKLWDSSQKRDITSDVPTPAYYDGDFFVLKGRPGNGALTRVDPKTGDVKWSVKTPGRVKYEASPLAADGKIYLINFDGLVAIFDAESGKLINEIAMENKLENEQRVRSTVIASHGKLFIRTNSKLFCIGK